MKHAIDFNHVVDPARSPRGYKARIAPRPTPPHLVERVMQIADLLADGFSYVAIGNALGVSRQRVHQLARRYLTFIPPRHPGFTLS